MGWIMGNMGTVLVVATIAIVVGLYLYLRYRGKQDVLLHDLEAVLADALEYLKGWAGDRLVEVTEAEVNEVADRFYDRLVAGTALEQFITRELMRATLWSMFVEWRDWFTAMRASIVEGGAHGRR